MSDIVNSFSDLDEDEKRKLLNELFKDNILIFTHFVEETVIDHDWMKFCSKCHEYCVEENLVLELCDNHYYNHDRYKYRLCEDCVYNLEPISCKICGKQI